MTPLATLFSEAKQEGVATVERLLTHLGGSKHLGETITLSSIGGGNGSSRESSDGDGDIRHFVDLVITEATTKAIFEHRTFHRLIAQLEDMTTATRVKLELTASSHEELLDTLLEEHRKLGKDAEQLLRSQYKVYLATLFEACFVPKKTSEAIADQFLLHL